MRKTSLNRNISIIAGTTKGITSRCARRLITQSVRKFALVPSCQNAVHLPFRPQDGILREGSGWYTHWKGMPHL